MADEMRQRLKQIRQDERRSKDGATAHEARAEAWGDYIERLYQLNPMGVPDVAGGR